MIAALMKKADVYGIVGGILCLGFASLDEGWRILWAIAGILLIIWSVVSAFSSK